MAGCILFVAGAVFDVDVFLKPSKWNSSASPFYKGQKSELKRLPQLSQSGFKINISNPDDNIELQMNKATVFLEEQDSELRRLKGFSGVEEIELRFGGWWYEDTAAFVLSLPPKLISLAGRHGLEVSVCVYATTKDQVAE
jgi:hypothetical protein